jgi:protein O-GlcNAc transferase
MQNYKLYEGVMLVNREEAQRTYELYPDNLEKFNDYIEALYKIKEFDSIERETLAAIKQGKIKETQELYNKLGYLYTETKRWDRALESYEKALSCDGEEANVYFGISRIHFHSKNYALAIQFAIEALRLEPMNQLIRSQLAIIYDRKGEYDLYMDEMERVILLDPFNVDMRYCLLLSTPSVFASFEEAEKTKLEWLESLSILREQFTLNPSEFKMSMLFNHGCFFLSYTSGDLLAVHKEFGDFRVQCMQHFIPSSQNIIEKRSLKKGEKIRVGFISEHLTNHSITKTHGNWLKDLDRSRFHVTAYHFKMYRYNETGDFLGKNILESADEIYEESDLQMNFTEWVERIRENQHDILIYPDIGMGLATTWLAACRLAPIQMNGGGHPLTSGLTTMDYFISSELMETEKSDVHYTEKLIRLPGIPTSYPYLKDKYPDGEYVIPVSYREQGPVFVNCQSVFKNFPQYDSIYPRIALEVPNASFHFIAIFGSSKASDTFRKRLEDAFLAYGLSFEKHCVFHPYLEQTDFFSFLDSADIFLDAIEWAGFNSGMEAASCDLPVVTFEGDLFRGRHGVAILKLLDLEELIAQTVDEYVDIAVKLALQTEYRKGIAQKIHANKGKIFNNPKAIRALEDFFSSLFQSEDS